MTFDQIQINLLLVMLVFFETAIILGQWLNHLAEDNEVRTIKISNNVTKFLVSLIAMGSFIVLSFLMIVSVYPNEGTNASIGIISGVVSGAFIILLQQFLDDSK